MAVLSALRRFAKLGFWVGLSAGAMLVDACSSSANGDRDSAPGGAVADASPAPDSSTIKLDVPPPAIDAGTADNPSRDAGQTDLWDIICE
jgi:hypothetical protein